MGVEGVGGAGPVLGLGLEDAGGGEGGGKGGGGRGVGVCRPGGHTGDGGGLRGSIVVCTTSRRSLRSSEVIGDRNWRGLGSPIAVSVSSGRSLRRSNWRGLVSIE